MTKLTSITLIGALLLGTNYAYEYNGSTTSAVTIVGGVIKSKHVTNEKKYPRKDCPVCKGKGWYISGDDISKVPCGYCEEESKDSTIIHPPTMIPLKAKIQ